MLYASGARPPTTHIAQPHIVATRLRLCTPTSRRAREAERGKLASVPRSTRLHQISWSLHGCELGRGNRWVGLAELLLALLLVVEGALVAIRIPVLRAEEVVALTLEAG